jgi:EAL domain-containing protein (putative c-di-GMP-specific phosphodiesterase class I)
VTPSRSRTASPDSGPVRRLRRGAGVGATNYAAGIQAPRQREVLHALDVHFGQGYVVGRAAVPDALGPLRYFCAGPLKPVHDRPMR